MRHKSPSPLAVQMGVLLLAILLCGAGCASSVGPIEDTAPEMADPVNSILVYATGRPAAAGPDGRLRPVIRYEVQNRCDEAWAIIWTEPVKLHQYAPRRLRYSQSLRFYGMRLDGLPVLHHQVLQPFETIAFECTYYSEAPAFDTEFAIARRPSEALLDTLRAFDGKVSYAKHASSILAESDVLSVCVGR